MKRKTLKIGLFIVIILYALFCCSNVFATSEFLNPTLIQPQQDTTANKMQGITGVILAVVQVVGAAIAVIMLLVLGIKYMHSAPNDRAEIKKHAVVYVVGAVVLFASSGILGIIRTFAENMGT